jgi:hypothetical protein
MEISELKREVERLKARLEDEGKIQNPAKAISEKSKPLKQIVASTIPFHRLVNYHLLPYYELALRSSSPG